MVAILTECVRGEDAQREQIRQVRGVLQVPGRQDDNQAFEHSNDKR